MRSSIDLGTNTCLLLIAEDRAGRLEAVQDFARVVRLGQGVDKNRRLDPGAMDRTLSCLRDYALELSKHGLSPQDTIAAATSQARDAQNGAEFFARVEKETGFKFRVISGDEEARCSFQGALLPDTPIEATTVIDIGGGSTELMAHSGGQSIDLGSVRFTERYLKTDPVTDAEYWACEAEMNRLIEPLKAWRMSLKSPMQLLGVAGTVTTIGTWKLGLREYDRVALDQCTLTRGTVHRLVEELKLHTVQARQDQLHIEKGRADVLLAGAMILWRVMEVLDFPTCRVSTRGLRFGLLQ